MSPVLTRSSYVSRCLSRSRALSETPRAATWLLCPLSYRTPPTVWYPAQWRRETGPLKPVVPLLPFCKDNCSMIIATPSPPACDQLITSLKLQKGECFFFFFIISWRVGDGTKKAPIDSEFFSFCGAFIDKDWAKQLLHDLIRRKTMYRSPPSGNTTRSLPWKPSWKHFHVGTEFWTCHCDRIVSCFFNEIFFLHLLRCRVQLTLCLKVRAW